MSIQESFKIAFSSLIANKMRAGLTMLGIIIGIAAVITLVSMGEGAKVYVSSQIEGLGSNLMFVFSGKNMQHPIESNLTYKDHLTIQRESSTLSGSSPMLERVGKIKYGNKSRICTVLGVTPEYTRVRDWDIEYGEFISKQDVAQRRKVCVIGKKIRQKLFGTSSGLREKIKVNGINFTVMGVMQEKGHMMEVDFDDTVFLPLTSAQRLFKTNYASVIMLKAKDNQSILASKREVKEILSRRHRQVEDFVVVSQEEILSVFGNVMGILTFLIGGIAGISLVVGGIGIMNIMLVSVTERTREIGIRKAIGAKRKDIFSQFLVESVVISLVGGMAGIGLGISGSVSLGRLTPLQASITLWSVLVAFFFAFATGIVSGVYPALRASHLDPIESLRYE